MGYAKVVRQYLFILFVTLRRVFWSIKNDPRFIPFADFLLSLYFYFFCGLVPCAVDLDDQTTVHFWIPNHRRHHRPNLVAIHGYGADARWQFLLQVKTLSKTFNLYMPDLLFFGKSFTKCKDRSPSFQAKCMMEGLKKGFGVERCSLYSLSYGGWVGYSMAEMYPNEVEKIVIVSSGVGCTADQKRERIAKAVHKAEDILIPRDPNALRFLVKYSVRNYDLGRIPDLFLWDFIKTKESKNRMQKEELLQNVMSLVDEYGDDAPLSSLSQETLIVWGKHDNIFPENFAHQLHKVLGPKAKLETLKESGHAANLDSPKELNDLIISFILGEPKTY